MFRLIIQTNEWFPMLKLYPFDRESNSTHDASAPIFIYGVVSAII